MGQRFVGALVIAAALLLAAHGPARAQAQPPSVAGEAGRGMCPQSGTQKSSLVGTISPQTLQLADGRFVRLAEILVMRRAAPAKVDPAVAAIEAIERAALGKPVEIAFGGRERDRYGVYLAHVFLAGEERVWLQEHLVRQGLALAYPEPDNHACAALLLAAEAKARAEGKGHWGTLVFKILPAAESQLLLSLQQTYQIVEGEVTGEKRTSAVTVLRFGDNPHRDFAVVLKSAARRDLAKGEGAWKGTRVRVRGFIERRRAPFITVEQAGQLEVLASSGAGAGL